MALLSGGVGVPLGPEIFSAMWGGTGSSRTRVPGVGWSNSNNQGRGEGDSLGSGEENDLQPGDGWSSDSAISSVLLLGHGHELGVGSVRVMYRGGF
eukprot:767108-Hanusia_phi.AAC.9